jgi:hypothetical protein
MSACKRQYCYRPLTEHPIPRITKPFLDLVMANSKVDEKDFTALQGSVVVITGIPSTASYQNCKTTLIIRQEHQQASEQRLSDS